MIKENLKFIKELRRELHMYPELSNNEKKTKNRLISILKNKTNLEVVDKGKWFYAIYKAKNPKGNIAFRADFDALPMDEGLNIKHGSKNKGISHKCGHDGHAAALIGLALEIDSLGADKDVYFLFQHAEETGDGAAEAVAMIKDNNITEIYGFHNWSGLPFKSVNVMPGVVQYASKGLIIKIKGSPTHASEPELGINPAHTIAKIILSLDKLTSDKENKGEVLATVIKVDLGEEAFGIAASEGKILLTIRALYQDEMERLEKNIIKILDKDKKEIGINYTISESDFFPETYNHEESVNKIKKVAIKEGIELNEMNKAFRSSEDYGHYTKLTKGALFYIGNGKNYPSIHTYEYDFRDENMEIAINIFKGLIAE